ncbi:MAG: PP2C family protein-serine/threonine phosphatase [Ardenticatenaceae bacterium]|nr:PP2C family protein-serine/threonine phosphatase [Ardenticatenaceae bacterium]MCB8949615.1 PP2C family protein-serine/threonine phosphatase [Ardenticatenaceae bacterium]
MLGITFIFFLLPFFVVGTAWLWAVTDWQVLANNWGILLFLFLLISQLEQRPFILPISLSEKINLPISTSLSNLLSITALLIFGPSVLWIDWLAGLGSAIQTGWKDGRQVNLPLLTGLNSLIQASGTSIVVLLLTGFVYTATGGTFPFQADTFADWLPAIWSILVYAITPTILYFVPTWSVIIQSGQTLKRQTFFQLFGGTILLSLLNAPFALPLTLVYDSQNRTLFILFCLAVVGTNMLAYFLSQFNLLTQTRSRELRKLENLGQALIAAPADASTLAETIDQHLQNLFPNDHLVIHLFAEFAVEKAPAWPIFTWQTESSWPAVPETLWQRICDSEETSLVDRNAKLPGSKQLAGHRFLVKILIADESETVRCVGAIYLQRISSPHTPAQVLPTLQELASQIGSALYRAQTHQEMLQSQKMAQELAFAGRIQQSFLPNEIPRHPNWDFAATLIPARQTSGDFYDFVPLQNGRIGLIVADVADKGTGAALYMALSRTLIRTYAMQFPDQPGKALQLANERILADTESDQFVTVFYGVLELENGRFTYANAGHNPTFHLNGSVQSLARTGIPLGMFEGMDWQQETIQIGLGDSLILYSDGVPEAQNEQQEEFGEARMLAIAQRPFAHAHDLQEAIATAVHQFVDDAPQFDDITLMVVTRIK